jgi:ribose transport system permease protein
LQIQTNEGYKGEIMLRKVTDKIRKAFQIPEISVLIALIVLAIAMSFLSPYFFTELNLFNILRSMSMIGIMAVAMTMVIITGGMDLSIGSILGVTGMLTARLLYFNVNPIAAIGAGLAFGILLGLINSFIITKVNVTPFIVTLGMLSIARGLTLLFALGIMGDVSINIPIKNPFILFVGGGYLGPVPFTVVIMLVLVILADYFLRNTVMGRQIYAVGSNETAARISGVNVNKIKVFVYVLMGTFCAIAGILNSGLIATAATNAGTGNEMDVIAAVVIGGASLNGGRGSIWGSIIGAAIMAVIKNAFILLHLPTFVQTITIGTIVVVAVSLDSFRVRYGKS